MVVFRGFAAIRIAVTDLPAAVSAWRDQLGWPPAAVSADGATFPLDGATIELRPASAGQLTGVTAVAVSVDDTERAVLRAESAGYRVQRAADGAALLAARDLNGVALEIRPGGAAGPRTAAGPFTRVSHIVVAVEDAGDARANWARAFGPWPARAAGGPERAHHVPVGAAWFGLTAAGTDAAALRRFLDRRGPGVYALGLVAGDRARTLERLQRSGARLIAAPDTGQVFVHPATTHGVLIEVVAGPQPPATS